MGTDGERAGRMAGAKAQRQDKGVEVGETGWVTQSSGCHSEDFPHYPKTKGMLLKGFKQARESGRRSELSSEKIAQVPVSTRGRTDCGEWFNIQVIILFR